jgi:hypothetical protein
VLWGNSCNQSCQTWKCEKEVEEASEDLEQASESLEWT